MLTGKDIHAAFKQHDDHAKEWEDISDYGRKAYEAVAEKLNASHIAPLQGLVKDLYRTIEEVNGWEKLTDEWAESLEKRFNELCGEEPKS